MICEAVVMVSRTYFSNHISAKSMAPEHVKAVMADIVTFNDIVHSATASKEVRKRSSRKPTTDADHPDMRRKENRQNSDKTKLSFHCQMKAKYHVDDPFANSAINTAKAAIQSTKELNKLHIEETQEQIKDTVEKLSEVQKQQNRLYGIKRILIAASKAIKENKQPTYALSSAKERYNPKLQRFELLSDKGRVIRTYSNAYLFEVQYIDPEIRWCKSTAARLGERISRLQRKLEELKTTEPGICYGSKKFFARHADKQRYPDHSVWANSFHKRRYKSLMISGRKDAMQGNFRFRYNSETHELHYHAQDGTIVVFKDVVFPYGQQNVNAALKPSDDPQPVAWRIIKTGGSFLIQCIVHVDDSQKNDCYDTGCIAMDTNYDNLSISELDKNGNVLRHKIISYNLVNACSGHAEQIISTALEEVFSWCRQSKKPLVMEDLKLKHVANRYGSKRRNFVTSRFAFSKVTELVDSKSVKYSIAVTKVNPAYTSQIGKVRYMKKYGLSIHEAASVAIGRRGLGLTEKLPPVIYRSLTPVSKNKPRFAQWRSAYKITKTLKASDMYAYQFS